MQYLWNFDWRFVAENATKLAWRSDQSSIFPKFFLYPKIKNWRFYSKKTYSPLKRPFFLERIEDWSDHPADFRPILWAFSATNPQSKFHKYCIFGYFRANLGTLFFKMRFSPKIFQKTLKMVFQSFFRSWRWPLSNFESFLIN